MGENWGLIPLLCHLGGDPCLLLQLPSSARLPLEGPATMQAQARRAACRAIWRGRGWEAGGAGPGRALQVPTALGTRETQPQSPSLGSPLLPLPATTLPQVQGH